MAFVLALIFSVVFYKLYKIRQERKLNEAVIKEQQKGLEAVILATEKERQRIAKDLHDGIGQTLSGIKLGLSKFANRLQGVESEEFANILNVVDDACNDVRSISHQMMPKALFAPIPSGECCAGFGFFYDGDVRSKESINSGVRLLLAIWIGSPAHQEILEEDLYKYGIGVGRYQSVSTYFTFQIEHINGKDHLNKDLIDRINSYHF